MDAYIYFSEKNSADNLLWRCAYVVWAQRGRTVIQMTLRSIHDNESPEIEHRSRRNQRADARDAFGSASTGTFEEPIHNSMADDYYASCPGRGG